MSNPPLKKSNPEAEKHVTQWMISFVEKPHPYFGNMPPCPYAQKARLENKITMVWLSQDDHDSEIANHIQHEQFDNIDVMIFMADSDRWTWEQATQLRKDLNTRFASQDKVVLEDHPLDNEKIGDVTMSNGKYCLLLAQRRSKLNRFSDVLSKTTDYYKNWSQQELDDVVTWRFRDL